MRRDASPGSRLHLKPFGAAVTVRRILLVRRPLTMDGASAPPLGKAAPTMAFERQTAIRRRCQRTAAPGRQAADPRAATLRLFELSAHFELLDEEPTSHVPGPGDAVARPALPARRPSPGRGSGRPPKSPSR